MSGEYSILYSANFYRDLKEIHRYIAEVLKAPDSADKIVQRIYSVVESLSFMPERYAAIELPSNPACPFHKAPCGNYGVYYKVIKEKRAVLAARVIRKGRDVARLLTL